MTTARSHDLAAGRLRTDEIGRSSRLAFSASDAEAVDLARQLGVERIEDLTAEIVLKPWGSGLAASGQGRARVTQLCVLTLEPVVADVGFAIDERFRPETPGQGGEVDLDAPDDSEPMTDGLLDLARLIADSLALALDPYPRAPGASLDSLETDGDGQGDGPARPAPFAALAALKRGSDDDR